MAAVSIGNAWAAIWEEGVWADGVWAADAAPAAADEPRGSTRRDQHPQYDFGEHYPLLRQEDKDRIDRIITDLKPKQRERLAKGRPSKAVRKKIAEVLPEYPHYTPKPQSEYLAEIEAKRALEARTLAIQEEMRQSEEEEAIIAMLLLSS